MGEGVAAIRDRALGALMRTYFETSYRLLTRSAAGRSFLRRAPPSPDIEVHGYFTLADLDALLAGLQPSGADLLLDLGCGIGDVARAIHRRSGAAIVGVDVSRTAINEARARVATSGMQHFVRFKVGTIGSLPDLAATSAYAVDSLMFLPTLAVAVEAIGEELHGQGRLFLTLLTMGRSPAERLRDSLTIPGADHLALEDVTDAFVVSSQRRRRVARSLFRDPRASALGRTAMALVLAEETLLGGLVRRGWAGRWRAVVQFSSREQRRAAPSAFRRSCPNRPASRFSDGVGRGEHDPMPAGKQDPDCDESQPEDHRPTGQGGM